VIDGWVLVVGFGSIGRRHYRNLKDLGVEDVRLLRSGREPAAGFETPAGIRVYRNLKVALSDGPSVVLVANPTAMHVEAACASLEAGACVLLEKPVAATLHDARRLQQVESGAPGVCSMAYCFRYHPLYRTVAEFAMRERIGRVFHARSWQASFLPSWHPWEDYRNSYAARKDLGGGVVRTLDHDFDLLAWILGVPRQVVAICGAIAGIGLDVEDTADIVFRFSGSVQANVHLTFGRRDYERGLSLAGDHGSLSLDWETGTVRHCSADGVVETVSLPDGWELNDMYCDMLEDALAGFTEPDPRAAIPLSCGIEALQMALGAIRSSDEEMIVNLDG
jgi:predicted dehydrogenase